MTNKRITELTALDGDDVANDDVLVIVDVSDTTMSASGTNKKITVAELVTDSALTGAFWPNSSTALTGANLANGDKLAVVDVGSPDVAKYITADELAQGSQFTSRYAPKSGDRVFVSAGEGISSFGTPTQGRYALNYAFGGWLLDSATTEVVSFALMPPFHWTTYDIAIWWANDSTGAGDVRWSVNLDSYAVGDDTSSGGVQFNQTATAGANNVTVRTTFSTGRTNVSGELVLMAVGRVGGDAADTLGNDCALLGLELVRAS
jgi:hypothetical protein